MNNEMPELELDGLRKQQSKARHDEVFGGLSPAERLAYDHRQNRIHKLEFDLAEQSDERRCTPVGSRDSVQS
jgi:hypothetical protein